jgi:putative SOS response-associated peptidase YedK
VSLGLGGEAGIPKPSTSLALRPPQGQAIFASAGLYDTWTDKKTGREIVSYTIITTAPNELVGRYHQRMPVILQQDDEAAWLNPDTTDPGQLLPLLKPYPADLMEEWHVSDAARNPRNDTPELIQPVS